MEEVEWALARRSVCGAAFSKVEGAVYTYGTMYTDDSAEPTASQTQSSVTDPIRSVAVRDTPWRPSLLQRSVSSPADSIKFHADDDAIGRVAWLPVDNLSSKISSPSHSRK